MSQQDRKTLKNYFSDGSLPTSLHYGDMIDSMVTWKDDGFDKSLSEGWRIAATEDSGSALMSYYPGLGAPEPNWTVALGKSDGTLHYRRRVNGQVRPGLSMSTSGRVGVQTETPEWQFDVDGVARMRGRLGYPISGETRTVDADGKWKNITDLMDGCQALEVIAGIGGKRYEGRYAMVHAIALNAYNPRNWFLNWLFKRRKIRKHNAVFGSNADRLMLRWDTVTDQSEQAKNFGADRDRGGKPFYRPYRLQIRTASDYGAEYKIRYYVTRLWFDSTMEGSRDPKFDRDGGFE